VADVAARAGAYRRLLAEPLLRRIAVADVCARVPQGMTSITLLLVVAQHASMAVAGLVLAAYTLGAAVTAPARGRLADRRGLFPLSAICAAGYALALLGLLAGSLARGPAWLLTAAAAAAGLLMPPLSPGVRSLWSAHTGSANTGPANTGPANTGPANTGPANTGPANTGGGLRQAAFALDAAVFDLSFIAGPALASALATGIAPAAALAVVLLLTGAAVAAVGRHSRTANPGPAGRPPRGPLRSPALRRLLVTAALANAALSATEVALTAYTRDHHALWASGPLLAGVSAGSVAGSLLLGTRPAGARAGRLPRLLGCYTFGLLGLAAATLYPPLLAVAAPLAGLSLGPTLATLFSAAADAAPSGAGTESQAWINSVMNGGAAAGAALAGLTVGRPALALALAAGAAAAGTLTALGFSCRG
jgi:MFS family permease